MVMSHRRTPSTLLATSVPNVSVELYNASLGGSSTLAAFMTAADSQSMSNWNNAYTAAAVDSYIQAAGLPRWRRR